ncbi:MAG: DUF4159 domain-containing protein [Pyrinomonadaceae bacterium]
MPKPLQPRVMLRRAQAFVRRGILPVALLALVLMPAAGQRRLDELRGVAPPRMERREASSNSGQPAGEFTFARMIYNNQFTSYNRRRGGAWAIDFPEADNHFITGIRDWAGTNLRVSPTPEQVEILDERLFDYPLIYIVEPGYMDLTDEQAARLREYLLRGGFLFLDDFWGEAEYYNVQEQLKKVLPEHGIKELPLTHPVFHSYLDIGEVVQVPNIYNAQRGITHEKGGIVPYYMGVEDKHGRLVVFIARNSDLGDAWEWINDSRYPVKYGLAAYKVGVNVVIYAMSH